MALYTSVNPETNKEKVWGKIAPYTNNLYPVFLSVNNRGGQVTTSTINTTTIPDSHKEEGMIAYQESTSRHFRLNGSNQWVVQPLVGSNGLYAYTKYAMDSNGTVAEAYKWDDGRLEFFVQYSSRRLTSARYEFWTLDFPRYYFPQKFISVDDPIARSTAVRISGGISWGDTYVVTDSYVIPRAMGTTSSTYAKMHVFVEGRWK